MITDEMVENAANAYYRICTDSGRHGAWGPRVENEQMRAALTAILPDIVEQCAKVVFDEIGKYECDCGAAACGVLGALAPKEEKP